MRNVPVDWSVQRPREIKISVTNVTGIMGNYYVINIYFSSDF